MRRMATRRWFSARQEQNHSSWQAEPLPVVHECGQREALRGESRAEIGVRQAVSYRECRRDKATTSVHRRLWADKAERKEPEVLLPTRPARIRAHVRRRLP